MAGSKFETGIDLRNQVASNAADGSNPTDLVTKQQLDAALVGLSWKSPGARAATTTNGTLATAFAAGQTIDGIVLATNDRILIKDQTTQTENGLYKVNASGVPTRTTDADSTSELNGAAILVTSGTTNADKAWTQSTDNPTIGVSNIVWAPLGGGTLPTAGAGLTLTGSTLDVVAASGGGLTVNANDMQVDATVTRIQTFSTHASATSIAITHTLGKQFIHAAVFITATGERIWPGEVATSSTVYTFSFGVAPTLNTLTFVLEG
jgi:hypothetical protein